jgi:hypothetical protein
LYNIRTMKTFWIFLIPLFIFSCAGKENASFDFLDHGISYSNLVTERQINEEMMRIQAKYAENPKKSVDVYEKSRVIFAMRDSILQTIETLSMKEKKQGEIKPILMIRVELLNKHIDRLKDYLISCTVDRRIKENLENNLSELPVTSKHISDFSLNLLKCNVDISCLIVLNTLSRSLHTEHLRYNAYEPFVELQSATLKRGSELKALISFVFIDTSLEFKVLVDDRVIFSHSGKVHYAKSAPISGDQSLSGTLELSSSNVITEKTFPFEYHFKVTD